MALSAADAATLVVLQTALDQLDGGRRVAEVSSNGRTLKFADTDRDALQGRIDALQSAALSTTGQVRRRGSVTFRFR